MAPIPTNLAQQLATLPVHHDAILVSPHIRLTADYNGVIITARGLRAHVWRCKPAEAIHVRVGDYKANISEEDVDVVIAWAASHAPNSAEWIAKNRVTILAALGIGR